MKVLSVLAAAAMAFTAPSLAHAKGGVTFLIDGDTFQRQFNFTNNSSAGERITGFGFDLSTIGGSRTFVFDTAGPSSGAFGTNPGVARATGLVSSPDVPDETQFLSLAFNDFDVGEAFRFSIDVDATSGPSASQVTGGHLVGARVYFDFSDGTRAEGFLQAIDGNRDASTFVVERIFSTAVPEPATWALLIGGFGLSGAALRQRRRTALAAC